MAVSIISALIAAGLGTYGAIKSNEDRTRAKQSADSAIKGHPDYEESSFDREMLADARSRVGAPSAGLINAGMRMSQEAANRRAFAQRNGISGAAALQDAANTDAGVQGGLADLGVRQDAYNQNNLSNYYAALGQMSKQHLLGYEGSMTKYGDMANLAIGQLGAANQNFGQSLSLAATGLSSLGNNLKLGGKKTTVDPQFLTRTGKYANSNMPGLTPAAGSMSVSPLLSPGLQGDDVNYLRPEPAIPGGWHYE